MGSILLQNRNIPLFEEYFGMLDYDWLVRVTADRTCKTINPVVIRYISKNNLSLNPNYRKKDFYMIMMHVDGNIAAMKRLCGTRGRYHYVQGEMRMARYWFRHSDLNWKICLYYITSYFPVVAGIVTKKFRVFG